MDKSENRTLIVKIVCVMLSFGLWLYISNVENPLRTHELKGIPVELVNQKFITDSKLAIAAEQQFTVDLKLEGPSSEIAKIKKEDFKIVADMSAYVLKSGENTIPVQIISYPENISIKNNGFLGIKVNLEELLKREFTIKSKVKVTYKEHIFEKEQQISPQVITVTGAKSVVEKIYEAVLIGEEKDIDKSKENEYDIQFIDSSGNEVTNVEADVKKARLSIITTNGKTVPINLKTMGYMKSGLILDGYELSQSNLNILGDSETLEKIDSINTEVVDLSSLQENSELNVKLVIPEGITIKDDEKTITVKFNVKKDIATTKNIKCNIQFENLNSAYAIDNSDSTVEVILSGTKSNLEKVSSADISVVLDLASLNEEGTFNYTPQATIATESNVKILNVDSINIIVKKK